MNKKLDQLIKLVALANNNPNENEANSAARKACKVFAEIKWNFKDSSQSSGPTTWNDIRRSQEPQWRSKPPSSGFHNPWDDLYKDIFDRNPFYSGVDWDKKQTKNERKAQDDQQRKARDDTFRNKYGPSPRQERYQEKVERTCTKCGNKFETERKDRTLCMTCEWGVYEQIKKDHPNTVIVDD